MRPAQNLARERSSLPFKFMAHGRLSMYAVWSLIHGHVDNIDWTLIFSIFLKKDIKMRGSGWGTKKSYRR